jgi:hypothetical protein
MVGAPWGWCIVFETRRGPRHCQLTSTSLSRLTTSDVACVGGGQWHARLVKEPVKSDTPCHHRRIVRASHNQPAFSSEEQAPITCTSLRRARLANIVPMAYAAKKMLVWTVQASRQCRIIRTREAGTVRAGVQACSHITCAPGLAQRSVLVPTGWIDIEPLHQTTRDGGSTTNALAVSIHCLYGADECLLLFCGEKPELILVNRLRRARVAIGVRCHCACLTLLDFSSLMPVLVSSGVWRAVRAGTQLRHALL